MFALPSLPPWNGMHPLVVHFPIALVMVAPLFVLLALIWKKQMRVLLVSAAVLTVLAAGGAWLAASTGSAAEDYAERVPGAKAILEQHEELGEAAQNFTTALAIALLLGTGVALKWGDKLPRGVVVVAGLVYLAANAAGAVLVANAAHEGGRLVHEVGVRAPMTSGGSTINAPTGVAPADRTGGKHDDD